MRISELCLPFIVPSIVHYSYYSSFYPCYGKLQCMKIQWRVAPPNYAHHVILFSVIAETLTACGRNIDINSGEESFWIKSSRLLDHQGPRHLLTVQPDWMDLPREEGNRSKNHANAEWF